VRTICKYEHCYAKENCPYCDARVGVFYQDPVPFLRCSNCGEYKIVVQGCYPDTIAMGGYEWIVCSVEAQCGACKEMVSTREVPECRCPECGETFSLPIHSRRVRKIRNEST
jgi:hypothetical protein